MILQSLYHYYEILLKDPEVQISPPGYSAAKANFALNLSNTGELLDLFPFVTRYFDGKKDRERNYRSMIVPEMEKRSSGVKPNFLCDNAAYVLGISDKDSGDPGYSAKRFEAFRKYNVELLTPANSINARAVIAFLKNHDPNTARENPAITRSLEELLKGGNLVFWVEGKNTLDDPEIQRVWESSRTNQEMIKMQCLVTGEIEPIARLHPNIQGVRDANPTGASLVGFNDRAYESYNRMKGQGLNSPTSQRVASGYGIALNYLLSPQNPNRKIFLGDTTVVYWAESENKKYANAFAALITPEFADEVLSEDLGDHKEGELQVTEVAKKVKDAKPINLIELQRELNPDTRFFILGLAPNAARLSVRFFLTEPFGKFVERIMLHYDDLKIEKEFSAQSEYITPYQILAECVSPKVTKRDDELKSSWGLLGGALMRSILMGTPYPDSLYTSIINRVRTDHDEARKNLKINHRRAAIIKACLLRKYRRQAQNPYLEGLQMSLNETFTQPAYVLGRLFAWLEKAQKEAIGEVNSSIKDRYFTSACATPASTFPTLLRLAQHYVSKAEYGYTLDRQIQDTLDLLGAASFPAHLTLDEQGVFILGYYHQRAHFYKKNSEKAESKSDN